MHTEVEYEERRHHQRKPCLLSVALDDDERSFDGRLRNLGLGGAFVETDAERPMVGNELLLTIAYQNKADSLIIKGQVVWVRSEGFGVRFVKAAALN